MGKSRKKLKSDRINALRKQYDAFLEDDKKRKDRNEYILGRLDEMRSSVALVKVRHKENSYINGHHYSSQRIPGYLYKSSGIEDNLRTFQTKTNIPADCLTKKFESSILKEINKNYILIPKLQSNLSSGISYQNSPNNVDADWKSKYNILNELKQNEKETMPDKIKDVFFEENHKSTIPTQISQHEQDNKLNDYIAVTDSQDYYFNAPNYELPSNKSNSNTIEKDDLNIIPDYIPCIDKKDVMELEKQHVEIPAKLIIHNPEPKEINQYGVPNDNKHEMVISQQQPSEPKLEVTSDVNVHSDMQNYDASEVITNIDIKNQLEGASKQEVFENESTIQLNKQEENFVEDAKSDEVEHTEKFDIQELTNKDNVNISEGLQEVVNENTQNEPEYNDVTNYETNQEPIDSNQSGHVEASELEKEQNEAFYMENSEKKLEYEQDDGDTPGYPAENANYTNEQYSYYDESQQEQPYTGEINEHEESTERYDPNYEHTIIHR